MAQGSLRRSTRQGARRRRPWNGIGLLSLPVELIARVASNLDQKDILALVRCCRTLHNAAIRQLFRSPTLKGADGWVSFSRAVAKHRTAFWVTELTWLKCDLNIFDMQLGPKDTPELRPSHSRRNVPVFVFPSCKVLKCTTGTLSHEVATDPFLVFTVQFFPNVTILVAPMFCSSESTVVPGGLLALNIPAWYKLDISGVPMGRTPWPLLSTLLSVNGSTLVRFKLGFVSLLEISVADLVIRHCPHLRDFEVAFGVASGEPLARPLWTLADLRCLQICAARPPVDFFETAGDFTRLETLCLRVVSLVSNAEDLDPLVDALVQCNAPRLRRVTIYMFPDYVSLDTTPFLERIRTWATVQRSDLAYYSKDPEGKAIESFWPGAPSSPTRPSGQTR